jgi:hypothetical protein
VNSTVIRFLGVLFRFMCLIYPRLGVKEASNLKMPMDMAKGSSVKNLLSLAKGLKKWPNTRKKTFRE